jgi:hypothetical protein
MPSRRFETMNSNEDSVSTAGAVAIAAPSRPKYGISSRHSARLTAKAVDRGADRLLADHVEEALGRAHGGAREKACHHDPDQQIAVSKTRPEQAQNRPAQRQQQMTRASDGQNVQRIESARKRASRSWSPAT